MMAIKIKLVSIVFLLVIAAINAGAQGSGDKAARVKNLIDSKHYVFKAESAIPSSGSFRTLTPDYDLRVSGDSLIAYLPYFGRAYSAPVNATDGGINFTSTSFDYSARDRKKGGWAISIAPKDAKDVRQLFLTVSANGYASLQVTSTNRQPITFNGYITDRSGK